MSLLIGIGFSDGKDAYAVGANACQDALRKINVNSPLFGLVFVSSVYDHKKVIDGIRSVSKDIPLIGASSAGEIVHGNIVNKNSVIVIFLGGSNIFFSSTLQKIDSSSPLDSFSKKIGQSLIREIGAKPDLSFMFTDVLSGILQHKLIDGVFKTLGSPVFGGASADDFYFKRTYQYFKEKVVFENVAMASMKGDFRFGLGMDHGMLPVGMPRRVTRSEGVNVYEIGGKPAVSLYGEYFGYKDLQKFTAEPIGNLSLSYPLGYRWDISDEDIIIRSPLFLKSDGSLVCTDAIPQGSNVQIMISDKEEALNSVHRATKKALAMMGGESEKASLALIISSAGRKYSYGSSIDDEVKEVERCLKNKVPVVGFYSYGSICATNKDSVNESFFQDNSVSVCLLK